jgi:hypothetical protein
MRFLTHHAPGVVFLRLEVYEFKKEYGLIHDVIDPSSASSTSTWSTLSCSIGLKRARKQ